MKIGWRNGTCASQPARKSTQRAGRWWRRAGPVAVLIKRSWVGARAQSRPGRRLEGAPPPGFTGCGGSGLGHSRSGGGRPTKRRTLDFPRRNLGPLLGTSRSTTADARRPAGESGRSMGGGSGLAEDKRRFRSRMLVTARVASCETSTGSLLKCAASSNAATIKSPSCPLSSPFSSIAMSHEAGSVPINLCQ